MRNWNRLLRALNAEYAVPNAIASSAKKVNKYYDDKSGEHVFTLEYRVRVVPGRTYRPTRTESLLQSVLGNP